MNEQEEKIIPYPFVELQDSKVQCLICNQGKEAIAFLCVDDHQSF
jgi:hypothetical protein